MTARTILDFFFRRQLFTKTTTKTGPFEGNIQHAHTIVRAVGWDVLAHETPNLCDTTRWQLLLLCAADGGMRRRRYCIKNTCGHARVYTTLLVLSYIIRNGDYSTVPVKPTERCSCVQIVVVLIMMQGPSSYTCGG